jgi:repressor LexA
MSDLGPTIRARRLEIGLSLRALAQQAGCALGYLSEIERGLRANPPSQQTLDNIEHALHLRRGTLRQVANWQATPRQVKRRVQSLEAHHQRAQHAARRLASLVAEQGLDHAHRSGDLLKLVHQLQHPDQPAPPDRSPELVASDRPGADRLPPDGPPSDNAALLSSLPVQVPLINSVSAGYPREFTDLGYPARVADEYVAVPGVWDADAFAARVVGDSMTPDYHEGDIVVFSPAVDAAPGRDCFARLEHDDETTFKRVFFERDEGGREFIRLQPLNPRYAARTLPREQVAGLYAAVYVVRAIRPTPLSEGS